MIARVAQHARPKSLTTDADHRLDAVAGAAAVAATDNDDDDARSLLCENFEALDVVPRESPGEPKGQRGPADLD